MDWLLSASSGMGKKQPFGSQTTVIPFFAFQHGTKNEREGRLRRRMLIADSTETNTAL